MDFWSCRAGKVKVKGGKLSCSQSNQPLPSCLLSCILMSAVFQSQKKFSSSNKFSHVHEHFSWFTSKVKLKNKKKLCWHPALERIKLFGQHSTINHWKSEHYHFVPVFSPHHFSTPPQNKMHTFPWPLPNPSGFCWVFTQGETPPTPKFPHLVASKVGRCFQSNHPRYRTKPRGVWLTTVDGWNPANHLGCMKPYK